MSIVSIVSRFSSSADVTNLTRPDHRGWWSAVLNGLGAGVAIGSGSSGMFHWDRLGGPIAAGIAVGVLTVLLAKRSLVLKAFAACCVVVGSCLATITFRHWTFGHWPMGRLDGKLPVIAIVLMVYVSVPATLAGLVTFSIERRLTTRQGR